jgi:hypothetical protein
MAFSTKLGKGSSQDGMPSKPCGVTSKPRGLSKALNSLTFPELLEAKTIFFKDIIFLLKLLFEVSPIL